MRLLIVQVTGQIGGAEVSLVRFVKHATAGGVQVRVILLDDGPLRAELVSAGASVLLGSAGTHFRRLDRTAGAIRAIARESKRWQADLVFANGTKSHLYGSLGASLARKPYVWTLFDILERGVTPLYRIAPLLRSDRIITDSDAVGIAARAFSGRLRNTTTIYHGVDLLDNGRPRGKLRHELEIPDEVPIVGVVGRLQRWKGQSVFVEASRAVLDVHPDAHFVVVGHALFGLDTDYPQELRDLAGDLGVEHRVHFLGHRSDVEDLLPDIDILALTSVRPEPFGIVQIEAMAAGKPVISSRAGGSPEVVVHGVTGFLVTPGSVSDLAAGINVLIADPQLRGRLGLAGRARVREKFTAAAMTSRMLTVFAEVIQNRTEASPACLERPLKSWSKRLTTQGILIISDLQMAGATMRHRRGARDFQGRVRGLLNLSVSEGVPGSESVLYTSGDSTVADRARFDADRFGYFCDAIGGGTVLELGANPYILTYALLAKGCEVVAGGHPSTASTPNELQRVLFTDDRGEEIHNVPLRRFNVETDEFPFPAGSFDVVICGELIEHLPRGPFKMLFECNRVLRDGGLLLLSTPGALSFTRSMALLRGRSQESWFSGQSLYGRHHRLYTLAELEELATGNNFSVVERTGFSFPQDRSWYRPGPGGTLKRGVVAIARTLVERSPDRRDCIALVARKVGPPTDFRPPRFFGGHDGILMVAGQPPPT